MSEMVERVAQAINPFAWYADCADPEVYRNEARVKARAAIKAMRELSEAMVNAGAAADWVGEHESRDGASILPDTAEVWDNALDDYVTIQRPGIWQAMIDEALK